MTISVRFSIETENRLNMLAKKTGRSKSYYIKQLITEHLDDLEDCYMADKIYGDILKGKERLYSAEEVRQELGLDS